MRKSAVNRNRLNYIYSKYGVRPDVIEQVVPDWQDLSNRQFHRRLFSDTDVIRDEFRRQLVPYGSRELAAVPSSELVRTAPGDLVRVSPSRALSTLPPRELAALSSVPALSNREVVSDFLGNNTNRPYVSRVVDGTLPYEAPVSNNTVSDPRLLGSDAVRRLPAPAPVVRRRRVNAKDVNINDIKVRRELGKLLKNIGADNPNTGPIATVNADAVEPVTPLRPLYRRDPRTGSNRFRNTRTIIPPDIPPEAPIPPEVPPDTPKQVPTNRIQQELDKITNANKQPNAPSTPPPVPPRRPVSNVPPEYGVPAVIDNNRRLAVYPVDADDVTGGSAKRLLTNTKATKVFDEVGATSKPVINPNKRLDTATNLLRNEKANPRLLTFEPRSTSMPTTTNVLPSNGSVIQLPGPTATAGSSVPSTPSPRRNFTLVRRLPPAERVPHNSNIGARRVAIDRFIGDSGYGRSVPTPPTPTGTPMTTTSGAPPRVVPSTPTAPGRNFTLVRRLPPAEIVHENGNIVSRRAAIDRFIEDRGYRRRVPIPPGPYMERTPGIPPKVVPPGPTITQIPGAPPIMPTPPGPTITQIPGAPPRVVPPGPYMERTQGSPPIVVPPTPNTPPTPSGTGLNVKYKNFKPNKVPKMRIPISATAAGKTINPAVLKYLHGAGVGGTILASSTLLSYLLARKRYNDRQNYLRNVFID